jgi:hypothetical protein
MPKYYFLTDPSQTYSVGPFIKACSPGPFITINDSSERYFGQVIRSNEFSHEIIQTPMQFDLWVIETDSMSVLEAKNEIHQVLSDFSKCPNIEQIGRFEGIVSESNLILKFNKNAKEYVLEFRCNHGIIFCPSLTIK